MVPISDEISLILHHNGKFIQNENGVLEYVDVCYLVPGIGLQKLENDHDVFSMCQIGLADPEKEVHVYLENVESKGGPVSDIGPLIEVHAMPINCSVENMVKAVVEECTQNGIEDMDVDG
ncbi:hypothetical protein HKD37_06G017060 [Glycine soja]